MAGRIRNEDVALVKERTSIEDVISEHVTLRKAGPGALKGLCPFHDEKTPSFNVRPALGTWHCFGCNEGGDVFSFVQKTEHLTFVESVERLAAKLGLELRYEEGGGPATEGGAGRRTRLVEAHRVAEEFYHDALLTHPEARTGRDFLRARGFDSAAAGTFMVGYATRDWERLTTHLKAKRFTEDEIVAAGLGKPGRRGPYDSFRGRLLWPIRDITGDTVGFGARRLFDDDQSQAKYLNTAETPIYRKAQVLYGLDLAKRDIARERQVVVVEGYTDVMAAHLAGVRTAVASCGTAFGADHIAVLRRILRDEAGVAPARVIFTFDGDAAGQKAAMKAFEQDQKWASQSFVAVAPGGQDPCELRLSGGDAAVRGLVADAVPLFEFAVRTTLARFDLGTAEGRVQGIRAVAPMVAAIRDRALRPEYTRTVAGWIGVEVEQVAAEVNRAGRALAAASARGPASGSGQASGSGPVSGSGAAAGPNGMSRSAPGAAAGGTGGADAGPGEVAAPDFPLPDLRNPTASLEHQLLQVLLQQPGQVPGDELGAITADSFGAAAHREVFAVLARQGLPGPADSLAGWIAAIADGTPEPLRSLVSQLTVEPIRARFDPASGGLDPRYVLSLLLRVREVALNRQIADATSELRRVESLDAARAHQLSVDLTARQRELNDLRARLA